ncbi:MAG: PH domain-containing protein [Flavobacterium sp.]|nr:PH domain-containing protein [Flavobacterium sp.]
MVFLKEELFSNWIWLLLGFSLPVLYVVTILLYHLGFKKRGYAFRKHDVIYKSGLVRESTIIIPNNRVQHVALHQGFLSRQFGLASIELFTAGGNHSDLEISGLLLADAQKIKNMISIKINDNLEKEELQTSSEIETDISIDEIRFDKQNKEEIKNEN